MLNLTNWLAAHPGASVMGIVNATGDSFSEGAASSPATALSRALRLLDDGADCLDVGGESTRPGSVEVPVETELMRVVPLIEEITRLRPGTLISVDTRKSAVARAAVEAGASIINDVSMLRFDPAMAEVAAATGAALVLAHSRGTPQNMRNSEFTAYPRGVVTEVTEELLAAKAKALSAGVREAQLIFDPNLGFAKTAAGDWELLREIGAFTNLGPTLVGFSRKSFIGKTFHREEPLERWGATTAVALHLASHGVRFLRVHDTGQIHDALCTAGFLRDSDGAFMEEM